MAIEWSDEQLKVIRTRDRNILVSAAAGSGKTAVLVERIIKRILDENNPIDVDKLLIVTFTNAAAAEMRERILKSITDALKGQPDNEHLQKQMTYIHNAMITTIDSFCLNVVKEHFGEIGIDPGFRIGDNDELELLKSDVIQEMLDEKFEESDETFMEFIYDYISKQGKSDIEKVILRLYTEAMSNPYPEEWLLSLRDAYQNVDKEKLINSKWYEVILDNVDGELTSALESVYGAIEMASEDGGPYIYIDVLQKDADYIKSLVDAKNYDDKVKIAMSYDFATLPRAKKTDTDIDEQKKKNVQKFRDSYKKIIAKLKKEIFEVDFDDVVDLMNKCTQNVDMIVHLTLEFIDLYTKAKREKNLVDFAEIEHFALNVLVKKTGDLLELTETAKELSEEFEEILIDEYQDSNYVQETLLTAVSKKHKGINNIFMVGDVKQSIYKFRQAKPELFLSKFQTYPEEGPESIKICLSNNYRSRTQVLDICNLIFSQIMTEKVGGIVYNDESALHYKAAFGEADNMSAEVILINTKEDKSEDVSAEELDDSDNASKHEIESKVIADKISELMRNGFKITDKKTQELRDLQYSDIAILVRSMRGMGDTVATVLSENDIPVESVTTTGYFDAFEIKAILNYLSVLDNPRQDIPLVSVLRNIYEFTESELAMIRTMSDELYYDALIAYDGILNEKVSKVLDDMEHLREMVPYTSVYNVINQILEITHFKDFIASMGSGIRRTGNVQMLLDKAIRFENSSYTGLFNFVRYIEKIRKVEMDQGESAISEDGNNTVKLMTIHKSKGLEFPVVFLAGAGKQFNEMDLREKVTINSELGIGVDYIDKEKNLKYKTHIKKAVNIKNSYDNKAEELRVLYVALTRAKEKLIVVGSADIYSIIRNKQKSISWPEEPLAKSAILECKSYLEWIVLSLIRHRSMKDVLHGLGISAPISSVIYDKAQDIKVTVLEPYDTVYETMEEVFVDESKKIALINFDNSVVFDETFRNTLQENLRFDYKYMDDTTLLSKVSVSDVKHAYMEKNYEEMEDVVTGTEFSINDVIEDDVDEYMPAFLKTHEEPSGAMRGTAYHRIFELIDYARDFSDVSDVKSMIADIVKCGKISQEEADIVDSKKIFAFIASDIGKRMKAAALKGKLWREKQFVMGIQPETVFEEIESDELLLVQGIIDAMFEEDDKIVILDYKTDAVNDMYELDMRYRKQLELYSQAVSASLGKEVKELVIYSTKFGKELML